MGPSRAYSQLSYYLVGDTDSRLKGHYLPSSSDRVLLKSSAEPAMAIRTLSVSTTYINAPISQGNAPSGIANCAYSQEVVTVSIVALHL
jgi:hypothetical protein